MSSFELEGKLEKVFDTEQVSEKFSKREFVVKTANQVGDSVYEDFIKFQATQDRCDMLDKYKEGSDVKVSFNLRGREWQNKEGETKYFTNLEAWRVEGAEGSATSSQQSSSSKEEDDDLPF